MRPAALSEASLDSCNTGSDAGDCKDAADAPTGLASSSWLERFLQTQGSDAAFEHRASQEPQRHFTFFNHTQQGCLGTVLAPQMLGQAGGALPAHAEQGGRKPTRPRTLSKLGGLLNQSNLRLAEFQPPNALSKVENKLALISKRSLALQPKERAPQGRRIRPSRDKKELRCVQSQLCRLPEGYRFVFLHEEAQADFKALLADPTNGPPHFAVLANRKSVRPLSEKETSILRHRMQSNLRGCLVNFEDCTSELLVRQFQAGPPLQLPALPSPPPPPTPPPLAPLGTPQMLDGSQTLQGQLQHYEEEGAGELRSEQQIQHPIGLLAVPAEFADEL